MKTFSEFAGQNGKIALSLLPNGVISRGENVYPNFSLIFGLYTTEIKEVEVKNPLNLINAIFKEINSYADNFFIQVIPNEKPKYEKVFEKEVVFFNERHKERWEKLLKNLAKDKIVYFQEESKTLFSKCFPEEIQKSKKAMFDIQSNSKQESIWNLLSHKDDSSKQNVDINIAKSERIYNSVAKHGEIATPKYQEHLKILSLSLNKDKNGNQTDKNVINLSSLIKLIYKHPTMARYYGLIYDFSLDESFQIFYKGEECKILLIVPGESPFISFYYNENKTLENDKSIIKDEVDITSFKLGDKNKYYHGVKDFGLIKNIPGLFAFSNCSQSHREQTEKINSDSMRQNANEGKAFYMSSNSKELPLEGIYLFQTTKNKGDKIVRLNEELINVPGGQTHVKELEIGILGQTVAVLVTSKKDSKKDPKNMFSLCRRKAIYDIKGNIRPLKEKEEEGWLYTDVAIHGVNEAFHPQTVFHWTGYNLSVHHTKEDAHMDQNLTEEKSKTGFISEHDEAKYLKEHGFEYNYQLIEGSETQLVEGKEYHFLIRHVLSNGYTIPLKNDYSNGIEVTIEDLINTEKIQTDNWFSYDGFAIDSQVINPPILVASQSFEKKGKKSSESAHHMVIFSDFKQKVQRYLFPPKIDLQFAHFLGLLSQENLEPKSKHDYIEKGKKIVARAQNKVPDTTNSAKVDYLADVRGKHILITPADWFTKNYLKNSYETEKPFFEFSAQGDYFDQVEAGLLIAIPCKYSNYKKLISIENNVIQFKIGRGLQLKFNIQLRDSLKKTVLTSYNKIFTKKIDQINLNDLQDKLRKENIFITDNYLPGHAWDQFQITHAVAKPEIPEIDDRSIFKVKRPKSDRNKIFFTFNLNNQYCFVSKQLQIISTYKKLFDDGVSVPSPEIKKEIDDNFKKNSSNDNLLKNEYLSSIFNQKNEGILETEVYKNNFGFSLKLTDTIIKELKDGDEILNFNVGNNFSLALKFNNKSINLICENQILQETVNVTENEVKIQIEYCLDNDNRLIYDVSVNELPIPLLRDQKQTCLPFKDVSEKNLSLLPKVEQMLLEETNAHLKFIHPKNDFFVYRDENSSDYCEKEIKFIDISRFQEYYPDLQPRDTVSDPSASKTIVIPSSNRPKTPIFSITPLLFREKYLAGSGGLREIHARSMLLMFEIERPLQNGEKFVLILEEFSSMENKYKLSSSTCAIGRDITTSGRKEDDDLFEENKLSNFLLKKSQLNKYLSKYICDENCENKEIVIGKNKYKTLLLEPYFEIKKNKWIAIVALDQDKLKSFNAYNPFVKIVAAKYIELEIENNVLSEFSQPKFINVLSQRQVSIENIKDDKCWEISIDNPEQIKLSNEKKSRSIFVLAVRNKLVNGFLGDPVLSKNIYSSQKLKFHRIEDKPFSMKIEKQKNKILCVYEFETFDNSFIPTNDDDYWLSNSEARLIYAEEFE